MTMRQQMQMASTEANSLDTSETVPITPVPVSLVRADPSPYTKTDDSTVSGRVRLNDTTPEEDAIESSIFIKLQPCILRCTSDPSQEAMTWEFQGRDPVQDALYYQSSEIVADAKSLGAEVVRNSDLLGQDDAPLQMSCSLIPYTMSNGATPSDPAQMSKKTIGHSTRESPTCDVTSDLPEDETFSPKTCQNIVNMSVHNMITDSLEKSIKDVIKTTILKKVLLSGKTQQSIPCAPQILMEPDDVNLASCNNTPANNLKDTATDSNIRTPLVQGVGQAGQQSMSEIEKQLLPTSASAAVLPLWQTQEIVTMYVQDMTDSTEATAECIQTVSMESSKSTDGEVSKQLSPECDQTTQFTVTLPLENSLLWQTPQTMECISTELQEDLPVLPVYTNSHPTPPLPIPETWVPEKNVIPCTNQTAIKEVIAVSRRDGMLTPVEPQEIPVTHTHTRFSLEPTRFSQEPILTTSNSPSHQTSSETFISSVASNPSCPDKRKVLDTNNNFEEPPQKQFCLNSRVAASTSHPVLFHELTMPPLLQGQPQGVMPPVLPHFAQQGDTLPVLRSKLQSRDGCSNTDRTPPNNCTNSANAPWFNASDPNINYPGLPQCQPLKSNCQLPGLQSECLLVNNSAYTLPKYPPWTQEGPIMSTHPQISGESQLTSLFPGFAKRPVVSQPAIPQEVTNTPLLTPMGSLHFPSTDIHLPTYNFSRMPKNVQPQGSPTSQLPPLSYFSNLKPSIKELQHGASLASNSSSNFYQDKLRASAAVDRNQILQCIRRPPPPYQGRQVHFNHQDLHTITHLPRKASADLEYWRTDRLLQPPPHTVSIPAPNRETNLQAISLENYKNVTCLHCAVTIPTYDRCRVLRSDVVAVLKNAIDLSLPSTAEKPCITLCECCEEVIHTICSSRQALARAKEKFISSTSPEGYLRKKTYSLIDQHFCVNCNVMIPDKARRRLLFSQKNDHWVVANVIQSEFNISLAPEITLRKLYLCGVCYNKVKQVRSAQVLTSMAIKDFNLRMSPASHMFRFNQRFQGTGILT